MKFARAALTFSFAFAIASAALGAQLSKSVPKGWGENFEEGKAMAEKSGKLVLLAFSGSDWCGWCKKMEKEIYSDKKFVSEAKKKYVLLMIDNPSNEGILSPLAKKQNRELTKKFGVSGFPCTVVIRPSGEEVRRFGGYQSSGVDGFLSALAQVAEAAGVKGAAAVTDEDAKKDDRFFCDPADKGKVAMREAKQRKENAQSDFELEEFAGIKFGANKADGAPQLEKPFGLLSKVARTSYVGNKLAGFTLAASADAVKELSDEAFRLETCKLVRTLEGELGVRFAVTAPRIDFTGKKTSIVVQSSKSSGVLSVQFSMKK